jgi:iron complex outermembrane receptor protein
VAILLTGAPGAYAVAPAPDEPSAQSGPLQEVIVYARRRGERIEDTPLAISVRSGEQLREETAVLLEDIGRDVPKVRMVSSPQSVSALDVTMRGQTVNRSVAWNIPGARRTAGVEGSYRWNPGR